MADTNQLLEAVLANVEKVVVGKRADSNRPLQQLLISEDARFMRGTTAVVVTSSSDERWIGACKLLRARGVTVLAVLLEAGTFGSAESPVLVISTLAASGIPTYLVKRGDNLETALSSPNVGRL